MKLKDVADIIINLKDPLAKKETYLKRKSICDSCPDKKAFVEVDICNNCKCVIQLLTRFEKTSCPLKKW